MNPSAGIASFMEGFSLARHPGLRRYTWLPVGISLIVCVTGLYFAFDYLIDATNRWIAGLPEWLSWLDLLLKPLLYITGVLGGTWLFGLLAVLIASPFLGAITSALGSYVVVPVRAAAPRGLIRRYLDLRSPDS